MLFRGPAKSDSWLGRMVCERERVSRKSMLLGWLDKNILCKGVTDPLSRFFLGTSLNCIWWWGSSSRTLESIGSLLLGSLWPRGVVPVRVLSIIQIVLKIFILDWNTLFCIRVSKLFVWRIVVWDYLTVYEGLLLLITWDHITIY